MDGTIGRAKKLVLRAPFDFNPNWTRFCYCANGTNNTRISFSERCELFLGGSFVKNEHSFRVRSSCSIIWFGFTHSAGDPFGAYNA